MRADLRKLFTHCGGKLTKSSVRHTVIAANLRKLAELRKMADENDETADGPIFEALADCHEQSAADARELVAAFAECMKALSDEKVHKRFEDGDDDLMPMPSPVSRVVPDAPQSSLRPVFRSGMREFSVQKSDGGGKEDLAFETLKKITQIEHVEQ